MVTENMKCNADFAATQDDRYVTVIAYFIYSLYYVHKLY